jgi:RNA polymerase sigma-70 factor, ECF subfamily
MTDWAGLVREHGPLVWRTAYRLLGQHADAADCFQEAFAAALAFARRQAVADWPALLRRLATARAIDRLRRRYRERVWAAPGDFDVASPEPGPVATAEGAELAERLRQALAELTGREAEVFCLRCLDECSYAEIAAQLGISINAVGVVLHRARERLKGLLAEFLNHDALKKSECHQDER